MFHVLWAICSYIVCRDTDFFPRYLGGHGLLKNTLYQMPYFRVSYGIHEYSLVQIGFFGGDFFDTILLAVGESNYWEMFFHHMVTLTLLIGMSF